MIRVNVDYVFDLLTDDRCLIAEDIPFKAVLVAQETEPEPDVGKGWGFEDITFDECQIEARKVEIDSPDYRAFSDVWRELPPELKPMFQRWLNHPDNQERIWEWFRDEVGEE